MEIAERWRALMARVNAAAERAGRNPATFRIVAISKTVSPDVIRSAFAAGIGVFGESRAQELRAKADALRDLPIEWHFVGSLQTNKVRAVMPGCALIHSVDRVSLAGEIDRRTPPDQEQNVLVQVNTTGEASKSGVAPAQLGGLLDRISSLERISVIGLMTIGPLAEDPVEIRAAFRQLRELRDRESARERPRIDLRELSMGMSGDFEIALAEGATLVRIGTALFGGRR
jgi:pyridoxal phosphate enzyme (YggS family)